LVFRPDLSWEHLSGDEIQARSIRAMRNHIAFVKESSPWYREKLSHISPEDITTLEDVGHLPLTTKTELVDNIDQFTAVTPSHITETVVTSGSTGKPLIFPMTISDLDRLAFNEALSFHAMGVTREDRAQILVSLDRLFIAGMAYYRGLTLLGANTARIGVLPLQMQKHYIELLRPTVLVGVPSFFLKLGKELQADGFSPRSSSVEKIACIGESLRTEDLTLNHIGEQLEELWGASVFSTYGATELSVAYSECTAQKGNHCHPELIYSEIVDDDGQTVPDGSPGELVATTFGVEGVPLLRYRTGDITFKITGDCTCGRNSMRIGPILSRKSQMIKVKGTTSYPLTITNALDEMDDIDDYLIIIEGNSSLSDKVEIHVVAKPDAVPRIAEHLRARARVAFPVLISNSATIASMRGDSRKKIRILDKRLKR